MLEPEQERALWYEPCPECGHYLGVHMLKDDETRIGCTKCDCVIGYNTAYGRAMALREERGLSEFPSAEEVIDKAFEVPEDLFLHIVGHDDVKRLLGFGLKAKKPVHFLLYGPPASAKSLFLMELERIPGAYYALGSTSSRAGLRQTLMDLRPNILLIDELEKVRTMQDYAVLLSAMESGVTTQTMFKRHERVEHNIRIVAAANDISRVQPELRSRFVKIQFHSYTHEEFIFVAGEVVQHYEGVDTDTASAIANAVWTELRSGDVRDAVRVARMLEDPNDLPALVALLKRVQ